MAQTKLFGKDLKEYEDIDVDALLETLSPEELEQLGQELIDPDDSCIPPSERCRYKTDKQPTGPYNRKHLIDYIENKAKEEKDWEEVKPYTKEVRGKVWKPKEEEKIMLDDDEAVSTEWDDVLAKATEEELVDLAAILGFHGMLNQVQYHKAFVSGDGEGEGSDEGDSDEDDDDDDEGKPKKKASGFQGIAKHEAFKLVQNEPPNETDVDESLQKLQDNDPKLKELNLNNIKNISLEKLCSIGEALKSNTNLTSLSMANVRCTDKVAKTIAESLSSNKTLTVLNLESNYISGEGIIALLEAINGPQTLQEFRIANQRPQVMGNRVEMRIATLMQYNGSIKKFGIQLQSPAARVRCTEYVKRNNDNVRKKRMGQPESELPEPEKELPKSRLDHTTAPTTASTTSAAPPTKPTTADKDDESDEESDEESEEESDEE